MILHDYVLVYMSWVTMCTTLCLCTEGTIEQGCRSLLQEQAVQLGLDMFAYLVHRCVQLFTEHLRTGDFQVGWVNEGCAALWLTSSGHCRLLDYLIIYLYVFVCVLHVSLVKKVDPQIRGHPCLWHFSMVSQLGPILVTYASKNSAGVKCLSGSCCLNL